MRISRAGSNELVGTGLVGRIKISYSGLVSKLGAPNYKGEKGQKVDVGWQKRANGIPFDIYNYKDGHAYLGARGKDVADIKEWNIGGNRNAVEIVREIFPRSDVKRA